jgi:hypothetical protein
MARKLCGLFAVLALTVPTAVAADAHAQRRGGDARERSATVDLSALHNVQMNTDSAPPLPQNETTVAYDTYHPMRAVAAANDYVRQDIAIMRTNDGGKTWRTKHRLGRFTSDGSACGFDADPGLAFSDREGAFFLVMKCLDTSRGMEEVQLWKSVDDGATWTTTQHAAVAESNFNEKTGNLNRNQVYDKPGIAIDNSASSPHYGRVYVTYSKFHGKLIAFNPTQRADYCTAHIASTNSIPTTAPNESVWHHTAIVPDNPDGNGGGRSANDFVYPQVESDGTVDVTYVQESCNTFKASHLIFQKSMDGGKTFLSKGIRIDDPGQFAGPEPKHGLLPPSHFRVGMSPSFAINRRTGTLAYVYMNRINEERSGADISIQLSTDGGYHWSRMRYLSTRPDGRPAPNDQFFPWIDSDESGNFFAIWLDRRLDPENLRINTFQAESSNDGISWTNHRISTRSWNPDKGFYYDGGFIGDYIGVAASDRVIYPVWTDGRDSAYDETGIGETDVFTNVEIRS